MRAASSLHRVADAEYSNDATHPNGLTEVVRRARDGDVAAFEAIYREQVGRVFALCVRLSGDRERAKELTQDVFVRAWERLTSFRGESALSSWLHRLAVNLMLEQSRADVRRAARVETVGDLLEVERGKRDDSPDERIDLEQAIAGLPLGARTVFVLHEIEGYKHHEIAKLTGLAEGTLRAQLHRARRLLMEALTR